MGGAGAGVWYAMTLAVENDGRFAQGNDWNPPLEMNGWLSQAAPGESLAGDRGARVVTPAVDLRISNEGLLLVADMPGIPRDRIDIRVGPRYVEIIAKPPRDDWPDGPADEGRPGQDAARGPMAAVEAAQGGPKAQLRDGVLELRLPRKVLLDDNTRGRIPVR